MGTVNEQEFAEAAEPGKGYELSGKIMLSAIVILFAVVVFMVGLHLYARWYLIRLRRRQLERRRHRLSTRTHVVLYADNQRPSAAVDRGLDPEVLKTLPVYLYSSEPVEPAVQECAVCLSEFEEKEVVRLLPKCNHSFHIECIDMWFHSHSTCPLCRSTVEPVVNRAGPSVGVTEPVVNRDEAVLRGHCSCENGGTTSSGGVVRKGFEVRIDVPPRRVTHLENELTQSSPTSRMLSLKRILSMGRMRSPVGSRVTTPCGAGTSYGAPGAAELDLERGLRESIRVLTPR